MNIPPLLLPSFWFDTNPLPLTFWADRILLVLTVAITVVATIGVVYLLRSGIEKRLRRALLQTAWSGVWIGLVGLFLYALSYERVPVLSMRFLWVLWFAWIVWAKWQAWKRIMIDLPAEARKFEERDRMKKWLPKRRT